MDWEKNNYKFLEMAETWEKENFEESLNYNYEVNEDFTIYNELINKSLYLMFLERKEILNLKNTLCYKRDYEMISDNTKDYLDFRGFSNNYILKGSLTITDDSLTLLFGYFCEIYKLVNNKIINILYYSTDIKLKEIYRRECSSLECDLINSIINDNNVWKKSKIM